MSYAIRELPMPKCNTLIVGIKHFCDLCFAGAPHDYSSSFKQTICLIRLCESYNFC